MGRKKKASELPADEVDAFHEERDRRFGFDQGEEDDEEESQDEAIWDVGADSDEEEEEEEDDDEEEEEEEGGEQEDEGGWGSKKADFHGGDVGDEAEADTSEEEEEELEATRLQSKHAETIAEEDFLFGQRVDLPAQVRSKKAEQLEPVGLGDLEPESVVETIEVDTTDMSQEELVKLLEKQSPELIALLDEFSQQMTQLKHRARGCSRALTDRAGVQPLIERSLAGATDQGLSFLQVKNQLLLAYCTNVAFYTVLKASGQPVVDHPVVKVLVELRTLMEKLKPIDAKLHYQVDKLLKLSLPNASHSRTDLLSFKPQPNLEQHKPAGRSEPEEEPAEEEELPFGHEADFEEEAPSGGKKRRRKDKAAKGVERSGMLEEMRTELLDAPEESGVGGTRRSFDDEAAQKLKYEEETFTRMLETKADKKKGKRQMVERFDPLADIEGLGSAFEHGLDGQPAEDPLAKLMKKKSLKRQLSELNRPDLGRISGQGDADLPRREPGQPRNAYQPPIDQEYDAFDDEPEDVRGNELYEQVREQGNQRKQHKAERRAAAEAARAQAASRPDEDEVDQGSKRGASKKIIRNVGLVKYRNKDMKNPRVANRIKAKRKDTKLRTVSAAANMRKQDKRYSGEATGIRPNLVKSQPLTGKVKH